MRSFAENNMSASPIVSAANPAAADVKHIPIDQASSEARPGHGAARKAVTTNRARIPAFQNVRLRFSISIKPGHFWKP